MDNNSYTINLPFGEITERLSRIENLLNSETVTLGPNSGVIEKPITTAELCEFLGITEPTVIRLRKRGKIPFLQIGGSIRYNKSNVVQALEKNSTSKNPRS